MENAIGQAANRVQQVRNFVARLTHELRTPLNAIIGFTNVLLQNKCGNLTRQDVDFLERIMLNAKDQLQLINNVLDFSKIEAGRMDVEVTNVALGRIVHEAAKQLEGDVKSKPVKIILEIPEPLAMIYTDAAKLKQILVNLITNALKFTDRGQVTIRVDATAGYNIPTRIDVIDTGIGIPPNCLKEIFEPFQQLQSGKKGEAAGTGLGLTISRSLCDLLGFELQVRSELGCGSTFSILLDTEAAFPRSA
jgi:signal transduction histidine kinase